MNKRVILKSLLIFKYNCKTIYDIFFRDFETIFDVDYGNCYTFNYGSPTAQYNTSRPGSDMGMYNN